MQKRTMTDKFYLFIPEIKMKYCVVKMLLQLDEERGTRYMPMVKTS